jgi:hypothetical protein
VQQTLKNKQATHRDSNDLRNEVETSKLNRKSVEVYFRSSDVVKKLKKLVRKTREILPLCISLRVMHLQEREIKKPKLRHMK